MAQLESNLEGRLRNTSLPISRCMFPIFEAIVNSIYAIDDRHSIDSGFSIDDGSIRVFLKRDNNSDLFGGKAALSSVIIEDNGIGFNDSNFKSFCELDSMYRASLGCKGIGRLLWLKAFDSAEIQSTFKDGNSIKQKHFIFNTKGIKELPLTKDSCDENKTRVTLIGLKKQFQELLGHYSQEGIAKAVFEHCLWFFLREGGCPDIRIIDGNSPATNLIEIYNSYICGKESETDSFQIGNQTFDILHVRLQRSERNHTVSYCAGNRIVSNEKIKDVLGLYDSAIKTESSSFFYKCFVTSEYLDSHVSADRFSFQIPNKREEDNENDLYSDIYFSDIRGKVQEIISSYLSPYLKESIEEGKQKIQEYVDKKAPFYKPILAAMTDEEKAINPNMTDKNMDILLHSKLMDKEQRLLEEGHDVLSVKAGESEEDYRRRTQDYFNGLQELKQSDLTRYVVHRKIILELLKEALSVHNDGHYSKEEKIHQIIMPMRTTSDGEEFNNNNLWIIDERLVFHHFLASDKSFKSMTVTDCDSNKRPDLVVENMLDNPFVVSDKDNPPYASLRIVEFKRPMRDDIESYDDSKNPTDQCIDYVERIRQGKSISKNGRPFNISEDIPAYCYIICDLTSSMHSVCRKRDFRKTYDGLGYFGYNSELRIYFEVISFDQLLNSANERNASFFDKLGIPHD